jgi:hypothetical protein
MHQDHKIDLWGDGVRVTLEKICQNDGVDIVGLMDYDMPASGMVGRTHIRGSDMHVEWDNDNIGEDEFDDALFSMDDDLAPATMAPENVPHRTSSPFELYGEDSKLPGMFGSALAAYGCVVATLTKFGIDASNYKQYFKADWDLGDEMDNFLATCVPLVRSEGAAFWGGIQRKLIPYCAAMPASQAAIKVKQHGTTRRDLGPDVIVDWNRVSECARAIAVQLVADDIHAHRTIDRVDLAIDRRKVVIAPNNIVMNPVQFTYKGATYMQPDVSAVTQFLSQMRKANDTRTKMQDDGVVQLMVPDMFTGLEVARSIKAMNPPRMNVPNIWNTVVDDIDFGKTEVIQLGRRGDNFSIDDLFRVFARNAVHRGIFKDVREFQIMHWLLDLEDVDTVKNLRKLVARAYPDKFASGAAVLWNVAKSGRGDNVLAVMAKYFNLPRGIMQDHNYIRWWVLVRNRKEVIDKLARIIYAELGLFHKIGISRNPLVMSSGDINDPITPLSAIFRQRRNYWANRYNANSKAGKEKMVFYQVLSSVFRNLRVVVNSEGVARADRITIAEDIRLSAQNYCKKRVKYGITLEPAPDYDITEIQLGRLDDWVFICCDVYPNPEFSVVTDEVLKKVALFENDVGEFVSHVLKCREDLLPLPVEFDVVNSRRNTNPNLDRNLLNVSVRPIAPHSAVLSEQHTKKVKVKVNSEVNDPVPVSDEDGVSSAKPKNLMNDMMDDEEEDEAGPYVLLFEELREDFPDALNSDIELAVSNHGARILYSEYEVIKEVFEKKRQDALRDAVFKPVTVTDEMLFGNDYDDIID